MPIECTYELCTVSVSIGVDGKLAFGGGQCMRLLGTHYVHQFERCPVLAGAISQGIKFPDTKD
jgi:hypothetical protein